MGKKLIDIIDTTNEPNILQKMQWEDLHRIDLHLLYIPSN